MGVERYSQSIPASGLIEVVPGNYFSLFSSTAAINVRVITGGSSEGFNGISGGAQLERVRPWQGIQIIGAAGTVVEWYAGTINVLEDTTELFLTATAITGTVATAEQAADTANDNAPVVAPTAAATPLLAANPLRKMVRITAAYANPDACYLRLGGGAQNHAEIQPGMYHDIYYTGAIAVRNDSGGDCTFYLMELEQ